MDIETITITNVDGSITEHVVLDRGNDEFTSMPKAVWDELNADSAGNK